MQLQGACTALANCKVYDHTLFISTWGWYKWLHPKGCCIIDKVRGWKKIQLEPGPKGWKMTKYTESMEQISTEQCGRNALNAHLECTYTVAEDGGGHVVKIWCKLVPKGWKPKNDCIGSMEQISTKRHVRNMLNAHMECTYTVANDGGGHVVETWRKQVPKGWKTENDCIGLME